MSIPFQIGLGYSREEREWETPARKQAMFLYTDGVVLLPHLQRQRADHTTPDDSRHHTVHFTNLFTMIRKDISTMKKSLDLIRIILLATLCIVQLYLLFCSEEPTSPENDGEA